MAPEAAGPYHHIEDPPTSTTPLIGAGDRHAGRRRPYVKEISLGISGLLIIGISIGLLTEKRQNPLYKNGDDATLSSWNGPWPPVDAVSISRGKTEGVSEKSNGAFLGTNYGPPYPWTNNMLSWQRTGFHFQPEKNWMNGPMYYKGWYHFFYQYNPEGAIWGNRIVWGHAVSKDFLHWTHLPIAMNTDQWYDQNGVWSGSATILPDGQVILLYTGSSNESVQLQNLAYPANLSDPLLVEWVKHPGNPILTPPRGIGKKDFRDPTTAWRTSQGKWRITIGSKVNRTGIAFVYETEDFKTYELLPGVLHAVPKTGMWECVDFFPVSLSSQNGLDTSINGQGVKHVMKVSLDDDRHDYYAIGTYNETANTWTPDNPKIDLGIGIRYDYGVFYASKTFYDQNKMRRILWGWISESDSESADVMKGWASVQSVPRTLVLDHKMGSNLLQWPVEEIESLRIGSKEFNNVQVKTGSLIPLEVESASQVDIIAEFDIDKAALEAAQGTDEEFNCINSGGAAQRGSLGPFGLLVLADQSLSEQTSVHFYVSKARDGSLKTSFCTDQSRSSKASDVNKQIYGSFVPVLEGEKLSVRILVDHSIVEGFAQGGRTCITSRVYPTIAIYGNARVFMFNNATDANVMASVKIWQMNSTSIHPNSEDGNNSRRTLASGIA
ncbi:hypothetical protein CDL15_Pgr017717 [Punica granatum]|uniref:beta-fructofuranosidase n=1 Tax=Punica granatum TaxID=22663 RepID=A0A218WG50_PUNGR|nr:hypothetical protein CDL15_Pgr017717 [Punica granatum]